MKIGEEVEEAVAKMMTKDEFKGWEEKDVYLLTSTTHQQRQDVSMNKTVKHHPDNQSDQDQHHVADDTAITTEPN